MTKKEQTILSHLAPVEYGLHRDVYLCGISINNKDRFMYSVSDTVKQWVENNGGKFATLSKKIINHRLGKKGFVVQITFPYNRGEMKNVLSALYNNELQKISI